MSFFLHYAVCTFVQNNDIVRQRNYNNVQLAIDIIRGKWLLSDAEALLPQAFNFISHQTSELRPLLYQPFAYAETGEYYDAFSDKSGEDQKVVVIPMHGPLTKYWGCATVGTLDVASDLLEFASRNDVIGFVLDIDSPGGASNAVPPMLESIKKVQEKGKSIIAHGDMVSSAAYWIASQCDAIFLDNNLSQAGSIGAYASFLDEREDKQTGTRLISVYALESGDKNRSYREALDGKYELCQEELSELVKEFHRAVTANRPKLNKEADGVLSGALFNASKAVENGLADGIMSLSECVGNVFIRTEFK